MEYRVIYANDDVLMHYGVKGMKWGVRRYQNEDGQLTSAGRKRYIADKTRGIQKDIDSFAPHRKTGIKAKNGKTIMTAKEIDDIVKALETSKSRVAAKAGEKYDRVAARINSNKKYKNVVQTAKTKISSETLNQAKMREERLRKEVKDIFKKHPDLYDDFGGPDKIDDFELLELVLMEKGYD